MSVDDESCDTFTPGKKFPSLCKKCLRGKPNHFQTLTSECTTLLEENNRLRDEYYRLTLLQQGPEAALRHMQTEHLRLQEANSQWRQTLAAMGVSTLYLLAET